MSQRASLDLYHKREELTAILKADWSKPRLPLRVESYAYNNDRSPTSWTTFTHFTQDFLEQVMEVPNAWYFQRSIRAETLPMAIEHGLPLWFRQF